MLPEIHTDTHLKHGWRRQNTKLQDADDNGTYIYIWRGFEILDANSIMSPEGTNKAKVHKIRSEEGHSEQQVPISQLHTSAVGAYARVIAQFKYLAKEKQPGGLPRDTEGHTFPTSHSCTSRTSMTGVQRRTINPIPFQGDSMFSSPYWTASQRVKMSQWTHLVRLISKSGLI